MILTRKKHVHDEYCKCHHKGKHSQRFDDQSEPYITPLEEHFENFADSIVDTAENFLGLGKKAKVKRQARQERKVERQEARQEKRISRLKTRQSIRESKIPSLQAEQQADTTNQLSSQVTPTSKPISAGQTPMAQDSSGSLYQTLPDYQPPASSGLTGMSGGSGSITEEPLPEEAKGTEEVKTPEKKSKVVMYLVIVAVIVGGYFLIKKK